MKRLLSCVALLAVAALAVVVRADVKTSEKTTFKLEGMMGAMLNRAAGGNDGLSSTVVVKGNRMARLNQTTGQIIDLAEEKVYTLDVRKKEYKVMTFAEMRKQMEDAKAQMEKQRAQMNPEDKDKAAQAAKQLEFDVDVKNTLQHKTLAGYDAREAILTLTMREKGKTLEQGGGFVMTNTMWLAPRVAALDELTEFNVKFFKAVYGGMFTGMDMQSMNAMSAMLPGIGSLAERMAVEGRKLQGTPLSTVSVIETVKSAEQLQAAPAAGGGGIGGMLARRMNRGASEPRTTTLTTTHETLSIATSATTEDVAIPAGFKEKH